MIKIWFAREALPQFFNIVQGGGGVKPMFKNGVANFV